MWKCRRRPRTVQERGRVNLGHLLRLQDTRDDSSWRAPAPSSGYSSNSRQRVHLGGHAEVLIKPQHPTAVQGHIHVWKVNRLSRPKASGPGLPPRLTSLEYRGVRRGGRNRVGPRWRSWTYGQEEEEHRRKGSWTAKQRERTPLTSRCLRKRLRLPPWGTRACRLWLIARRPACDCLLGDRYLVSTRY